MKVKDEDLERFRRENIELRRENARLARQVKELTAVRPESEPPVAESPSFVKPNVPEKIRRKPGRPVGHEAALRERPHQIDVHRDVSLPIDRQRRACCPHCRTQLSEVKHHRRLVEDIVPSKVVTTCYHTRSGYCPSCRKRVESRAEDQPPAADLPHAPLGLDALATAAMMRVCYRLPLRQITQ